ncbi:hypothetical protein STSP2_02718 [Anaerohalosphaera lusitana]|uniref:Uncharacterized protein n=1 Tax=Anaerohalosphaera lusitana TaxID=1936003 RepID=A0A1U9NP01_9BACT|nr:hypothetical protein [Anaerohalosphaera lusitana]AQT69527.1 hypothetical protein STSP2_02718 [Anaerohalosphaera lusitana]
MHKQYHGKTWKIRSAKRYPQARNHIIIGRVVDTTEAFIRIKCRTFHFGRTVTSAKDIDIGPNMTRIVPWNSIEIVNELPDSFDYASAELILDSKGRVALKDHNYLSPLCSRSEQRY